MERRTAQVDNLRPARKRTLPCESPPSGMDVTSSELGLSGNSFRALLAPVQSPLASGPDRGNPHHGQAQAVDAVILSPSAEVSPLHASIPGPPQGSGRGLDGRVRSREPEYQYLRPAARNPCHDSAAYSGEFR